MPNPVPLPPLPSRIHPVATRTHCRFYQVPEDEGINRVYHSSALLLSDGRVYISGSNPNPFLVPYNPNAAIAFHFPTEFRTSVFKPPYLQWGVSQNILTNVSSRGLSPLSLSFCLDRSVIAIAFYSYGRRLWTEGQFDPCLGDVDGSLLRSCNITPSQSLHRCPILAGQCDHSHGIILDSR